MHSQLCYLTHRKCSRLVLHLLLLGSCRVSILLAAWQGSPLCTRPDSCEVLHLVQHLRKRHAEHDAGSSLSLQHKRVDIYLLSSVSLLALLRFLG